MLKKSLITTILLLSAPLAASAAQTFTCSLTFSTEDDSGNTKSDLISQNAELIDNGNTFSASPEGKEQETSPALVASATPDGSQIFTAKTIDGVLFAKIDGSYVIRNAKQGYVYSDCKPSS